MQIKGTWNNGTTTTGAPTITLPFGLSIDTAKMSSTAFKTSLGRGWRAAAASQDLTTGTGSIDHVWTYNGTATVVQMVRNSATLLYSSENTSTITNTGDLENIELITIPISGWGSSGTATSQNISPAFYKGAHDSTCSWSQSGVTTIGSADYSADASCGYSDGPKSNISCSSTGSKTPGIACTFPRAGTYKICAKIIPYGSVATGHSHRLWDGTTVISTGSEISNGEPAELSLCGPIVVSGISATFTIQSDASSGTNVLQSQRGPGNAIEWNIEDKSQSVPSPILVNSVINPTYSAITKVCSFAANTSGVIQRGDNCVTATASKSTGLYTYTFATPFSATPWACTCSAAGAVHVDCNVDTFTSSTIRVVTANAGSSADLDHTVICIGPN